MARPDKPRNAHAKSLRNTKNDLAVGEGYIAFRWWVGGVENFPETALKQP